MSQNSSDQASFAPNKTTTMKDTITKYGLRGFILAIVLFLIGFLVGIGLSYSTQEVIGYLSIFASLSLVYFAIRHYRDVESGGTISLGRGLAIGLLISTFVGLGSAVADAIYTTVIYPDFLTEYTAYTLENLQAELSPAEFEVEKAKVMSQVEMFGSPFMLALVMFVTVLIIGFIVSLISALVLSRKTAVAALV
jgi:heme/copper-type cytochrome/quinol oxidase subunit 4